MDETKVKIVTHVTHDGVGYPINSVVTLPNEAAGPLLRSGAVVKAKRADEIIAEAEAQAREEEDLAEQVKAEAEAKKQRKLDIKRAKSIRQKTSTANKDGS